MPMADHRELKRAFRADHWPTHLELGEGVDDNLTDMQTEVLFVVGEDEIPGSLIQLIAPRLAS
jgi:hypothetical protein